VHLFGFIIRMSMTIFLITSCGLHKTLGVYIVPVQLTSAAQGLRVASPNRLDGVGFVLFLLYSAD